MVAAAAYMATRTPTHVLTSYTDQSAADVQAQLEGQGFKVEQVPK